MREISLLYWKVSNQFRDKFMGHIEDCHIVRIHIVFQLWDCRTPIKL